MADPAGTYNDGGYLFDSQDITIGGTIFIAEDFAPMDDATTDVTLGVNATPRGARHRKTLMEFSGTLQFPSGADLSQTPAQFATFSAQYRGAAKNFILKSVGTPQKTGQETKVTVKICELINAPEA